MYAITQKWFYTILHNFKSLIWIIAKDHLHILMFIIYKAFVKKKKKEFQKY